MDLESIKKKPTRYAVGLVCGRSCRGIDAALVRLKGSAPDLHLKLMDYQRFPYGPGLRNRLRSLRISARELGVLHFELGEKLAAAAKEMLAAASEEMAQADFVSVQGHAYAFTPPRASDAVVGALELGETAIIAEHLALPVVSDFRARDMASGGQGGPLSAYGDWVLFAREDRTVVCLHLGSTASMTVVPPNLEEVIAFELGPANMAIDETMQLLTSGSRDMDEKGKAAGKGVVIDEFLDYLLDHPFFSLVPPKMIRREDFAAENYLRDALAGRNEYPLEDLVATVTAAAGNSIIRAYNRFIKDRYKVDRVVVTGGGVDNRTLMRHIRQGLPEDILRTSDHYKLDHDAHGACVAAILGNETVSGKEGNVAQATGARHPAILGKITLP